MRRPTRLGLIGLLVIGAATLWCSLPAQGQDPAKAQVPDNVKLILQKHCIKCHGDNNPKPKAKPFKVLDPGHLAQKLIREGDKPSDLWARLTDKNESVVMPPPGETTVSKAELDTIEAWLKQGGEQKVAAAQPPPEAQALAKENPGLANDVKEAFRTHCTKCHGDQNPQANLKILDYDTIVSKKRKVQAGKLAESEIFRRMISAHPGQIMPPPEEPRIPEDDMLKVISWIAAGAPKWEADKQLAGTEDPFFKNKSVVGVDYVLNKIRDDVNTIPQQERRFMRYISFNHMLVRGVTDGELANNGKALATAINHLSFQQELVRPRPIDGPKRQPFGVANQGGTLQPPGPNDLKEATIYCIDLRRLGWERRCFEGEGPNGQKYQDPMNMYDMVLLEYPYATIYDQAQSYQDLYNTYMKYAGMVRPIPFVRGDWFCSVCTSDPLYQDMLQLPTKLYELEYRLNVPAEVNFENDIAKRAGMTVSGVSRNNRIVERHPAAYGYYYKSIDFQTSKGGENMFRDPLFPDFTGGEMIFSLPNHLNGYLVTDNKGNRIADAPTSIVVDKFASDKTVRNGLACIRCHDQGVKPYKDTVRKAFADKEQALSAFAINERYNKVLSIYPDEKEMKDKYLTPDTQRFQKAYESLNGEPPPVMNPLTPLSKKFLDEPLNISQASAELGIRKAGALQNLLISDQFAALGVLPLATEGHLRRDAWEDYFDQLTTGLGLGYPIINIDALARKDYGSRRDLPIEFATIDDTTKKPRKTFKPGDKMRFKITNKSKYPIYCEVYGTSVLGEKALIIPCTTVVNAGASLTYPPATDKPMICQPSGGKEEITLYYCDKKFPPGRICRLAESEKGEYALSAPVLKYYELPHGTKGYQKWMFDRVVHPFYYDYAAGKYYPTFDPRQMCKKTITIGTE